MKKVLKTIISSLLLGSLLVTVASCGEEETPTPAPTVEPTVVPTEAPTQVPTQVPTAEPTVVPTVAPTQAPTQVPTQVPTEVPTVAPTQAPTQTPTVEPTTPPVVEDPRQFPVELAEDGLSFTYGYQGDKKTVQINEKAIYVDGRLSDEDAAKFPNVYNTFNAAIAACIDGTEAEPMMMYIAPYVYWIHDPASEGTTEAYGITKSCAYLNMIGLTNNPENVVIAGNYGHDEGYQGGNWTMFNFSGDGLTLKNIRFGGYCNIDLEYPLDPSLNVPKRTSNVTQCQIASYNGDKLYAENCDFISRLNMMPFNNSKRALYVNCHMESTDDSLNGSSQAVYLGCDFEFYSSKPWGGSSGVTLLDCDMTLKHINTGEVVNQYLAKFSGRYNVIDSRFHHDYTAPVYIGFSDILSDTYRSYYSNVTVNGQQIDFSHNGQHAGKGVDITGTEFLKAYKLVDGQGNTIYNVYNLLRGKDGWDPLGQKEAVEALMGQDIPTNLSARTSASTIESGNAESVATITPAISGPQSTDYAANTTYQFIVAEADQAYVQLTVAEDGKSATVVGTNNEELARLVIIRVVSSQGIEAAVAITVTPSMLEAPQFITQPTVQQNADGTASVTYELDLGERADMSEIIWSVSDNADGSEAIAIAIGRTAPLMNIDLLKAYEGKYLVVSVRPKHVRSPYGEAVVVVSAAKVDATTIPAITGHDIDLSILPTNNQPQVIPGFITFDNYKPADTYKEYIPLDGTEVDETFYSKNTAETNSYYYGTGAKNGFKDYTGIYQASKYSRVMYTAERAEYGDMDLEVKLAPGKTAGQGFGSANQYMDILIKWDSVSLTGYGLRVWRNTGDSCKVALVEWRNGLQKILNEAVVTSAYLTECTVKVWTAEGKLHATLNTTAAQSATAETNGYVHEIDMVVDMPLNVYGGWCIQHAGTVGDNVTYIGSIKANWTKTKDLPKQVTLEEAATIGSAQAHNTYTTEVYEITGVVKEVQNTTYGNILLTDGENDFLLYGLYVGGTSGTRYDAMTAKPLVGDTITVQGGLGQFNGTPQMKNAELVNFQPKVWTDAEKVTYDKENTTITFLESYVADASITLVAEGARFGSTITWEVTAGTSAVVTDGKLVITPTEVEDTVTLVATITNGEASDTVTYTFTTKVVDTTGQTFGVDFTAKSANHNSYIDTWTYDGYKVSGGANNNGAWDYIKLGGKSSNLATLSDFYVSSPMIAASISKVTVDIKAGSLSKSGMSVTSWGLYVYSDEAMTQQVDYVAGGTITSSAATFEFVPSNGTSWAANCYYKVVWVLANTSSTNGIIYLNGITLVS